MNKSYLKNKNVSPGKNTCEYLILHHTGAVGDGNIKVLAGLTLRQVSVHYLVRQDGEIYQFVDEDKIARHCGESNFEGKTDLNRYSIGIEVESDGKFFSTLQKQATIELIKEIISRHKGIKIVRHKDLTSRKIDIGDNFWNSEYKTFDDFILQFTDKMTPEQIRMMRINLMNSNSLMYDLEDDKELKDLFAKVNKIYRDKYKTDNKVMV